MPIPPPEFHRFIEELIPFNRFLGVKMTGADDGFVRLELPFRPEFIGDASRPALHGGVISTLIDACGGFAVWTKVRMEDRISTIDLRVDYLAPGAPDRLIAEANVVRVGNRVGVVDVRCFQPAEPDRIVATGKGVYNIKRREDV
jgi:uncharacterized protein (TIGR00369 family)